MIFRPWPLRLLPRHRQVMRHGASAKAIVLESRRWGWTTGGVHTHAKLKLKVHFDGGDTTTIIRVERRQYLLQDEAIGSVLPMRHDPADRSYIDIDRQALIERHRRLDEETNRARVQDAEDRLRRGDG